MTKGTGKKKLRVIMLADETLLPDGDLKDYSEKQRELRVFIEPRDFARRQVLLKAQMPELHRRSHGGHNAAVVAFLLWFFRRRVILYARLEP